jgi:hypothetical protein
MGVAPIGDAVVRDHAMTAAPPNTDEIAQELWLLAARDTALGDMLVCPGHGER